jgi:hypothetical protein
VTRGGPRAAGMPDDPAVASLFLSPGAPPVQVEITAMTTNEHSTQEERLATQAPPPDSVVTRRGRAMALPPQQHLAALSESWYGSPADRGRSGWSRRIDRRCVS